MVKNLPERQEAWVQSLGWEDLLEKEMATHSSILNWRIQWTEKPDGLQSMVLQESDTTDQLTLSLSEHFLFLVGLQPALNTSALSAASFPFISRSAKIYLR